MSKGVVWVTSKSDYSDLCESERNYRYTQAGSTREWHSHLYCGILRSEVHRRLEGIVVTICCSTW